jgi:hypothetical protein
VNKPEREIGCFNLAQAPKSAEADFGAPRHNSDPDAAGGIAGRVGCC